MFRRSRFSIRPNVGTAGRTAATPQEGPSANQEASENPKDVSESSIATAVTDNKSVVTPSEKPTASGDGNDQNGEGTSSSAAVQRRKRFSIKPKVAPGRPSTLARSQKSPVKAVSETSTEVPVPDLDKPTTSSQTGPTASPQRLQSPRRRRPSEESKQPKMQPKPTLIPSDSSEPSALPTAEDSPEQPPLPRDSGKELESTPSIQVKEVPPRIPDKVPPSLPDKEAIEISEKAKTLVSSKCGLSMSPPAFSLSRLLNDPSDLQRLAKAQKLRELLKQEMNKEKKMKKAKARAKEYTLDPAKMTMRDLIRYLPVSNPMTSSLEESAQENETVVPPSPAREESPERAQQPEVPPKIASPREEEEAEVEAEAEAEAEEEEDEGIMVPQVKVAEDGSLIIDEESLTVEVQRTKGPNPAQDRDPIFERGSTTTYSSFRKGTYSKPWSSEETDMFFLAISMVGTDFSMICQLFPHRARSEIKNKFKKEERENAWRIDKAFRERRKLDIEYFSKLLEKIMEVQKNRKKLKSLAGKKSPKKPKRKAKDKKAARKLSVVEEEDEEEQNEIPDLEEEEGEKENEDLCNEGGTAVAKPKKKRKRKSRQDDMTEEPNDKKNKTGEKSDEQDEAYIPEDAEAALPEDCPNSDMSKKTDNVNAAKNTTIKPAKLSRGRAPKPLLPLGRKWGKKPPPPSTKANDGASDKGDESVIDGASEEQVNKDASPNKKKSAKDDISSEEEDATVQPPRPTRYGRVPKPTKPLNYPAKETELSSETTPTSPVGSTTSAARPKPKTTAKRGRSSKSQPAQESKRPKLVTLRASQSEYSDEEDEMQQEEEEVEEEEHPACSYSKDSTAPVFVPASLRSPHPVISEVEETMEELDILANMPDVLGISQDALCPDASCEQAQNETGTAEPCEHQLDLLVDVIDFLSSEHTEVSEDASYNEAAQTLLTIGNLAHLSQSAPTQITIQDHITVVGTTSASVNETSQQEEEEVASMPASQEEKSAAPLMYETSGCGVTETSETVTTVELQNSTTDNDDVPNIKSSDQSAGSEMDPTPQWHSSPESPKNDSPQAKKGRLPKVKPKPNLGQASRTTQSKSEQETSTVQTAEESCSVVPDLSQATETLSATKEPPKIAVCSQQLLKDTSCIEAKLTGEPSGNQQRSGDQVKSGAATSDQNASENQNISEAQFEPSREQATREPMSTSESSLPYVGITESSCNDPLASDSAVTESQICQGSNRDSAPVQESSDHPAPCITPVEPVSQKEESEVASTCQTRRSRFQRVKPNLTQTPRTVRSKPQPTRDTIETDSNQTPNPKFDEKRIVEVGAEPTCTTSLEKPSQSHDPASDLIPSLELGSTLPSTDELSTTEDKKTNVGVVCQVESCGATSDQSNSGNQNFSGAQFEPSREQATKDTRPTSESTDDKLMSHVGTTENSCKNVLTSDSAATESQIGQGLNRNSVPAQESSDHSAPYVTPVGELPLSQKEESKVASTCQTRRSRFQKVKPNLAQTSRTVRPKPETTKVTMEKDSNQAPKPKVHEKTIVEVEAEPTCTTFSEKPSQIHDPASDLTPSLELGSTLSPTEEMSSIEDRKTNVGVVCQVESGGATSDQCASENRYVSGAQLEPSSEQATTETRPTSESTHEKQMSVVGISESSCNDPLTSESAVIESQVGQGSNRDSAPVQESSDHPAPCVTSVEELPVDQKEQTKVAFACQTRRSRFQRVKPNLSQTSRTVRPKPETTKVTMEKDSNQTPKPKVYEKTTVEVEAEPTCTTFPEKPSQSHDPSSDLTPSLDLGSTLSPTEEMSSIEDKKANVRVVCQVESGGVTSDQCASENRYISGAQLEPSSEQATTETRPTSESAHEKQMSVVGISESSCKDPLTSELAVSDIAPVQESSGHPAPCSTPATPAQELPVSQKEESEGKSTCQSRRGRLQKVKPKPNIPQRTVHSEPQTSKDPVTPTQLVEKPCSPTSRPESTANITAQVEAKPTCTTILPEAPSQIKTTGSASVSLPSLEVCSTHKTTDKISSTEEQKTDAVCGLEPESSEQNVFQRRQRFPKVKPKPNLGSSLRTTRTKLQSNDTSKPSEQSCTGTSLTSEQQPVDNDSAQTQLELTTDSKHLTSTHCSLHSELSSTMLAPAESEKSLDSINDKGTSSDGVIITTSWVAENQSVLTDTVLENESIEKPTLEEESTVAIMSNYDKVEAGPASQWDCKQDMSIKTTETKTQPTDDPTAVSDIQSSEGSSAQLKIEPVLPTTTQYTSNPKEGAQPPQLENDSEAQNQDAAQKSSETTETNQTAAQSTDNNQSEPVDCPSIKPAPTRRGRLIKPKPSLGRSNRPRQPQQVQNTKQAEAAGVHASVCYKPVSEHQPDILEPAEGAIEQCSDPTLAPNDSGSLLGCLTQVMEQLNQHDPAPDVAGSSLGCVKQVPYSFTQDASTSSTGGTQSHPSLTIFPDMLPQQEPSDPDEPFFILSLTEIPVSSAGEVLGSVPEPLPYLPVTDASVEQQSGPGESLTSAGDGLLSNVAMPVSMAESAETGLISITDIGPDPSAYIGSVMENPVDPHESTTVHPSTLPETIENNETEITPTKQRLMSTRGRGPAKLQVKPNTTKRKEASKALAAKEAEPIPIQTNTTLYSELPGPSVQPKAFDDIVTEQQKGSGDHAHAEKQTLTGGEDPENSSSGALIKRTRGTSGRSRKPKETNNTAPLSDSPPGKAASRGAKVKTPRAAGKQSTPASVASTSHNVAPTPRPTRLTEEIHSTSSTASPTHTQVDVEQTSEHSRLCSDTTPITPLCPAEVSAPQQNVESSSIEEEPTSVSQYFLSDIFTEVEDG